MSLSKQQMLGAVGAGVFVLCAAGCGFGLYLAWDERREAEDALAAAVAGYRSHYAAAVFPSKRSLDSVKSNTVSYTAWYEDAHQLAARGDKRFPAETPPIFKQRLQGVVRRLASLPGGVEGKIAAPSFLFGFEQYLGEGGVLPKDGDVPRLAMQLDTIAEVVDLFARAGVLEVKAVQRIERKADAEEQAPQQAPQLARLDYAFEFTTRPAALMQVLNALTASARFMTVKDLSFRESADMIVERLNAAKSAKEQKASGGRARRRARRAAAEDAPQGGTPAVDALVIDPELDAPLLVRFVLEVRDFGRAAAPAAEASPEKKAASEKKGEGK